MLVTTPAVWLDIQSPAECYWFWPLYKKLSTNPDTTVVITSRDHGEVLSTLAGMGMQSIPVLSHPGASYFKKFIHFGWRVRTLVSKVRMVEKDRDIAVKAHISHSPYGQVAARVMKVPPIYVMDDPHASLATKISLNATSNVIHSSYIADDDPRMKGRKGLERTVFEGIIEGDYVLEHLKREIKLGLPPPPSQKGMKRVVLRPAPTRSEIKHSKIIWAVAKRLAELQDVETLVIPRYRDQLLRWSGTIRKLKGNLRIFWDLGGLPLVESADLTITGGATMSREAALLGKTGITCYPDELEVDKYFEGRPFAYEKITKAASVVERVVETEIDTRKTSISDVKRKVAGESWTELALKLLYTIEPEFETKEKKKGSKEDKEEPPTIETASDDLRDRLLNKISDPASRVSVSMPKTIEHEGRKVKLVNLLKKISKWEDPNSQQVRSALEERAWLASIVEDNKVRISTDLSLSGKEAEKIAKQTIGILRGIDLIDGVLSGRGEETFNKENTADTKRWLNYIEKLK